MCLLPQPALLSPLLARLLLLSHSLSQACFLRYPRGSSATARPTARAPAYAATAAAAATSRAVDLAAAFTKRWLAIRYVDALSLRPADLQQISP